MNQSCSIKGAGVQLISGTFIAADAINKNNSSDHVIKNLRQIFSAGYICFHEDIIGVPLSVTPGNIDPLGDSYVIAKLFPAVIVFAANVPL